MSDPSGPGSPPAQSQPAPYAPPPPPSAPGYAAPPATGYPGSMPPPITPSAMAMGGAAGLLSQVTGNAGWSLLLGVATIAVPLLFDRVFFFLPIVGLIAGIRAIQRGQLVGGITGIVLNAIGGLITIVALIPQ